MKKLSIKHITPILFLPVASLLLISVFTSYFNSAKWPFIAFVGLFFPLLYFLNILFLLLFILLKSRWWKLAVILLFAGLYQLTLLVQFNGRIQDKQNRYVLKLVSFNTGNPDTINPYQSRREAFAQEQFLNSDIICLQEFTPVDEKGLPALKLLEHRMHVNFNGKRGGAGSGLSVYSIYPLLENGYLKLQGEDTYALWCELDLGEDTLMLINVQLQSIRLEDEEVYAMTRLSQWPKLPLQIGKIYNKLKRGFEWRTRQVSALKAFISQSDHPVILCGDLNDPPNSFAYAELNTLLKDAFVERGYGLGFTYAGQLPFLRIDYMMADDLLNFVSYDKLKKTHSDHYPVAVSVTEGRRDGETE